MNYSYKISKEIDRGIVELVGPNGLSNTFYNLALNMAKLDSGVITTYALYITISLLFFVFIYFISPSSLIESGNINIISENGINHVLDPIFSINTDFKEKGIMEILKLQNSIELVKLSIILIFCLFLIPSLNSYKQSNYNINK
jgi:hypothetical protein